MKHIVHHEPDFFYDAMTAMIDGYQKNTMRTVKEGIFENGALKTADGALERLYDASAQCEDLIASLINPDDERAVFLFKERDKIEPLAYALWHHNSSQDQSPMAHRLALFETVNTIYYEDSPCQTEATFFEWLDSTELTVETKYDMMKLYHQFDEYSAYLGSLILEATQVLRQSLPGLEAQIQAQVRTIEDNLNREGIGFLRDRLGVEMDESIAFHIYPSVTLLNGMTLYCRDEEKASSGIMIIGLGLFDTMHFIDQNRSRDKRLTAFLKALADPTKWRILALLSGESLYSAQLAERMELSGPTISHHMVALANLQIVMLKKQGNRIYYAINRPVIKELLEELNRQLSCV